MRELPAAWTWALPMELASPEPCSLGIGPFGSDLKVSDYREDGVPLVFVRNIRAQQFGGSHAKHVSLEKAGALRAHTVRPGDVLITKMGDPPGDAALYPLSAPPAIVTADCIRWRIDPRVGEPTYYVYATRARHVQEQIHAITQGVAQRKVSVERFKSVRYPVAPVNEQARIAAALDSYFSRLDNASSTLARVQRNLERYRASVLKAAVEGRLVPTEAEVARAEGRSYEPASALLARATGTSDHQGAGGLPHGWAWTTLGRLAELKGGITKGQRTRPGRAYREVPYLRVANVQRGYLDLSVMKTISASEAEIEELRLSPGDVLFNEGGDRDKLGRGWVWKGELPECIHQNHVFRARIRSQAILPELLSWYGNTEGQRYFFDEGKHTTNLASINMTKLRGLPVRVPPFAEQMRICAAAEAALSIVDAAEATVAKQASRCARLRQSVLKWAFEGRLVDQDSADEQASVLLDRIRAERASAGAGKTVNRRGRRNTEARTA